MGPQNVYEGPAFVFHGAITGMFVFRLSLFGELFFIC